MVVVVEEVVTLLVDEVGWATVDDALFPVDVVLELVEVVALGFIVVVLVDDDVCAFKFYYVEGWVLVVKNVVRFELVYYVFLLMPSEFNEIYVVYWVESLLVVEL